MVQDSFRFPTKAWLREYLQNNRTMEAPALVAFVKATFHETAVLFQPQHVSEGMLVNQVWTIVKRLTNKSRHTVTDHPDPPVSEGGSCETLQPPESPPHDNQLNLLACLGNRDGKETREQHFAIEAFSSEDAAASDREVPWERNAVLPAEEVVDVRQAPREWSSIQPKACS